MLRPIKITKIEQAKNLLYLFKGYVFINSSGLPFLFLFLNSISYSIFCNYLFNLQNNRHYIEPDWIKTLDLIIRQICDIGLLGLICLLLINYRWKSITWVAFTTLSLLWIVNTIFNFILPGCKEYETNALYFVICLFIIYLFFIILSIYKLINKN